MNPALEPTEHSDARLAVVAPVVGQKSAVSKSISAASSNDKPRSRKLRSFFAGSKLTSMAIYCAHNNGSVNTPDARRVVVMLCDEVRA